MQGRQLSPDSLLLGDTGDPEENVNQTGQVPTHEVGCVIIARG